MAQKNEIRKQRDRIREQAKADEGFLPPAWKPDKGAQIEGTIERVLQVPDRFNPGKTKPALLICDEKEGFEVTVYVNHTVLLSKLMEIRPKVGDWLLIKCHGKGQKEYLNFSVYTDRPVDTASIWSKFDAEHASAEDEWQQAELSQEAEEGTGTEPAF